MGHPDPHEFPYLLESEIINLSRRLAKIHKHLDTHPNDESARRGKEKLKEIRKLRLRELWRRDYAHYKKIHLICESIKQEHSR